MEDVVDEEESGNKPTLPRLFPSVLIGMNECVTIKDIEDMANGVAELELDSENYQPDLQEVHEFVQEFTREYYPQGQPTEEKLGRMAVDEAMHLASSRFKERTSEMGRLKKKDIPRLRAQWLESCKDILGGVPDKLPPLRGVNHSIPLKDDQARYAYYLPRCPESMKGQLRDKIQCYTKNGWWESARTSQAAPMLCVPKKDMKLRTTVDCRKRNENTIKDVTPLPDQDYIRLSVARALVRSKIDLSDAYEQVRIVPEDVWKTAFSSIYGTFVSHVMQQGDCNAPSTFQRLMNSIFQDYIGDFLHVYLDDLFIFSDTIDDHEKHLELVFQRLRDNELYLKATKCELYAEEIDCLGHKIDDRGLHADTDKLGIIRNWRVPRNYHDVQKFLGLVNYLAHFLPDISAWTTPISDMSRNGQPFFWRPVHDVCMQNIKNLCCKTPILKPVDARSPDPIWVVCDASTRGVGAMYGQGPTWQTCRPAGFMSKKFSDAQRHYRVFEQETLAILEALLKWEDKLVGYRVHVVTDHRALEFFMTQRNLSSRQMRWMEYLSRFDFDITYVKGVTNKVADALSRYHEYDTPQDRFEPHEYVSADVRIDPACKDLPPHRRAEVEQAIGAELARRAEQVWAMRSRDAQAQASLEPRDVEAASMEAARSPTVAPVLPPPPKLNPTVFQSRARGHAPIPTFEADPTFFPELRSAGLNDPMLSKILEKPADHPRFTVEDGLVWTQNLGKERVLCVPRSTTSSRALRGEIVEQAHAVVGHYGPQRTADYIRRWFWWPGIFPMAEKYCQTCEVCMRSKGPYTSPAGKLHSLPIPSRPWQSIAMDFLGPFPETDGFNYLWVVVCRLTGHAHLVPVNTKTTATELSFVYLKEIVRHHGLPESIVSDRDSKFTSVWWKELHRLMGTKLLMSTSFHPQTDGATERLNRSIGQIFRASIRSDQRDWLIKVPMIEFALNSSMSSTTGFAPFELTSGHMPCMMWKPPDPSGFTPGIRAFAAMARQSLAEAHDAIIASRVFQAHHANKHRGKEPLISVGDRVFLSTKNLNLPKDRASKLLPKFVGPYAVLEARPETSNYKLDLPEDLRKRRIHDVFHVSLLRPYIKSDSLLFPDRSSPEPYDFGAPPDGEEVVQGIEGHYWLNDKLFIIVRWALGDTTAEPIRTVQDVKFLDDYLDLMNVRHWKELPRIAPPPAFALGDPIAPAPAPKRGPGRPRRT